MPTVKLDARNVKSLPGPSGTAKQIDYFDTVVKGFGMRVGGGGRRSWIFMYRSADTGKKKRETLGTIDTVPLGAARDTARGRYAQVVLGGDPQAAKMTHRHAETVQYLAADYLEKHAKARKKSWRKDESILERDVLPAIGDMKARDVRRRDVNELLDEIKRRGAPILANRTLAVVRKMYNHALSRDFDGIEFNPCQGIAKPAPEKRRQRVLNATELTAFWKATANQAAHARDIFRLMLLTAQREAEVLRMRWQDIDTDGWWTIPPDFAKKGLAHRVPLSAPVADIIEAQKLRTRHGVWVFPNNRRDSHATDALLRKPMDAIRLAAKLDDVVPHDLRRTAASRMTGDLDVSRLVVSRVLNHVESGVTAIYDRHSYDREKKHALEAWGARLMEIAEDSAASRNVVDIAAAR